MKAPILLIALVGVLSLGGLARADHRYSSRVYRPAVVHSGHGYHGHHGYHQSYHHRYHHYDHHGHHGHHVAPRTYYVPSRVYAPVYRPYGYGGSGIRINTPGLGLYFRF